jgi:hypothetical protein
MQDHMKENAYSVEHKADLFFDFLVNGTRIIVKN